MKNKNYINIILLFLLCILTSCGITEDADCKQQKTDESKCVRAFALYCANNKSQVEAEIAKLDTTLIVNEKEKTKL